MDAELLACVRGALGWGTEVSVSTGARGALGEVWRVDVAGRPYAVKEIFGGPPVEALVVAELEIVRRAVEAGVRVPRSHAGRDGRYAIAGPGGTWLRVYDWADMRPLALGSCAPKASEAREKAADLGMLFARLHRCAPAAAHEFNGTAPVSWYHRPPPWAAWQGPIARQVAP